MENSTGFWGGAAPWWLLLAAIVIAVIIVRVVRSRASASAVPPPLPEPTDVPVDAALLDSSHIGGPIAGTEQFQRFNPDTSARNGKPGPGSR